MLAKVLLAAGTVLLAEMPISASAEICEGVPSWVCANGVSTKNPMPEQASQIRMTASSQYWTEKTKKSAGSIRSPDRQGTPSTATGPSANCLSRSQVRGEQPRYRTINGRQCWYVLSKLRQTSPKEIKIDIVPHNNPIRRGSDPTFDLADCELQALKLDGEEKRTFMKDCSSNSAR